MKYKKNFSYSFADNVNPPRFKGNTTIEVALEFPFPKNIEDALQELKQLDKTAYAAKKLDQFQEYTGMAADKFQSAFDSAVKKEIDSNYIAFVKKSAKPNFDANEWKKILTEFEKAQQKFVASRFSDALSAKVKVEYEKLAKIRSKVPEKDEIKVLSIEEAFLLWTGKNPVKFSEVEDKFFTDHMRVAISHQAAFEGAVARYKAKASIKISTWIAVDEKKILELANGAKVYPTVHTSGQQVAVQISIPSTKVVLDVHEGIAGQKKEAELQKKYKYIEKVKDVWVSGTFTSEKNNFYVIGKWEPDSGDAQLYHYQEAKPAIGLDKKYLRWIYSHAKGKYIGPDLK